MKSSRSGRKLSNVKLTRAYNFSYMGLWILMTVCLIVVLNAALYLLVEQRWGMLRSSGTATGDEFLFVRQGFLVVIGLEMICLVGAVFALAAFTANRVAGPYLRLREAFREVKGGNLDYRLQFRKYDHLAAIAADFNDMLAALQKGPRTEQSGDGD